MLSSHTYVRLREGGGKRETAKKQSAAQIIDSLAAGMTKRGLTAQRLRQGC